MTVGPFGVTGPIGYGPIGHGGPLGCTGPINYSTGQPVKQVPINIGIQLENQNLQVRIDLASESDVKRGIRIVSSIEFCIQNTNTITEIREKALNSTFPPPLNSRDAIEDVIKIILSNDNIFNIENIESHLDELNEKLAAKSFRNLMHIFKIRNKLSLERAQKVLEDHFIVEFIHDI